MSSRALVLASALGIALKAVADHVLSRRLRGVGFGIVSLPWLVVKDVPTLGLWAIGAFRRTVTWRGHRMRIGAGTHLYIAPPEQGETSAGPADADQQQKQNRLRGLRAGLTYDMYNA